MASTEKVRNHETRVGVAQPVAAIVALVVSIVALVISFAGATWIFSPANAAAKAPAASLSFSDLNKLFGTAGVPTTWEQHNYFAWLAWVLLALVVVVGAAAVAATRHRMLALATLVVGLAGLVLTTYAFKGQLTWQEYWDGRENLRLGGYLAFIGFLATAVAGGLLARRGSAHLD